MKGKTRGRKPVVQNHHISYNNPEIVVKIYKGEHWILTQMNRRKRISKGFIKSLRHWLALNKDKAKELR